MWSGYAHEVRFINSGVSIVSYLNKHSLDAELDLLAMLVACDLHDAHIDAWLANSNA